MTGLPSPPPVLSQPPALYAPDKDGQAVLQYEVNARGMLVPLSPGWVPAVGPNSDGPTAVVLSPNGRFAYATGGFRGAVSQYLVRPDGRLAPLSPPSASAGEEPTAPAFGRGGHFAYVSNSGENTISQYAVAGNGLLTPLVPPTVAASPSPIGTHLGLVAVSPDGRTAYAPDAGGKTIAQFRVQPDGTLTALGAFTDTFLSGPAAVTFDAAGRTAYVANRGGSYLARYDVGLDGRLGQHETGIQTGREPSAVILGPGGRTAYVANRGDGTISQYRLRPNGKLTALFPPAVPGLIGVDALRLEAEGHFLDAVSGRRGTVSRYRIGPDGALSVSASSIDRYDFGLTLDPAGRIAYTANPRAGTVSAFAVAPSGPLTPLSVSRVHVPYGQDEGYFGITLDRTGRTGYMLSDVLTAFDVDKRGVWTARKEPSLPASFSDTLLLHPARPAAYLLNFGSQLEQYALPSPGAFAPLAPPAFKLNDNCREAALDPHGRALYVVSTGWDAPGAIRQYQIGTDGSLSPFPQDRVLTGNVPQGLCFSPSGRYAFTWNDKDRTLSRFAIGPDGSLSPLSPRDVALPADTRASVRLLGSNPARPFLYLGISASDWQRHAQSVRPVRVGADGSLTFLPVQEVLSGAFYLPPPVFSPDGSHYYLPNEADDTIALYQIRPDGSLRLQKVLDGPAIPPTRYEVLEPVATMSPSR